MPSPGPAQSFGEIQRSTAGGARSSPGAAPTSAAGIGHRRAHALRAAVCCVTPPSLLGFSAGAYFPTSLRGRYAIPPICHFSAGARYGLYRPRGSRREAACPNHATRGDGTAVAINFRRSQRALRRQGLRGIAALTRRCRPPSPPRCRARSDPDRSESLVRDAECSRHPLRNDRGACAGVGVHSVRRGEPVTRPLRVTGTDERPWSGFRSIQTACGRRRPGRAV
jgi:hypothetical protein